MEQVYWVSGRRFDALAEALENVNRLGVPASVAPLSARRRVDFAGGKQRSDAQVEVRLNCEPVYLGSARILGTVAPGDRITELTPALDGSVPTLIGTPFRCTGCNGAYHKTRLVALWEEGVEQLDLLGGSCLRGRAGQGRKAKAMLAWLDALAPLLEALDDPRHPYWVGQPGMGEEFYPVDLAVRVCTAIAISGEWIAARNDRAYLSGQSGAPCPSYLVAWEAMQTGRLGDIPLDDLLGNFVSHQADQVMDGLAELASLGGTGVADYYIQSIRDILETGTVDQRSMKPLAGAAYRVYTRMNNRTPQEGGYFGYPERTQLYRIEVERLSFQLDMEGGAMTVYGWQAGTTNRFVATLPASMGVEVRAGRGYEVLARVIHIGTPDGKLTRLDNGWVLVREMSAEELDAERSAAATARRQITYAGVNL